MMGTHKGIPLFSSLSHFIALSAASRRCTSKIARSVLRAEATCDCPGANCRSAPGHENTMVRDDKPQTLRDIA